MGYSRLPMPAGDRRPELGHDRSDPAYLSDRTVRTVRTVRSSGLWTFWPEGIERQSLEVPDNVQPKSSSAACPSVRGREPR